MRNFYVTIRRQFNLKEVNQKSQFTVTFIKRDNIACVSNIWYLKVI